MQTRLALAACLAAMTLPLAAIGFAQVASDDGDLSLFAYGSARFTGAYLHYPESGGLYPDRDDALTSTLVRLMIDGDLGQATRYELNLYGALSRAPAGAGTGAFATAASARTPYRARHLRWDYWRGGDVAGRLGVDRAVVSFDWRPVGLSVGRMPVNHSLTDVFAPNDFFAPFSATAINTDYKPGVDALRLRIETGPLSGVELDAVLGSDDGGRPDWGRSAVLAQMRTVVLGVELGLLGGAVAERWVAGASLQGEAGGFGLRAEGHLGFADLDHDFALDDRDGDGRRRDELHARLSVGLERMFPWRNAVVAVEYAYLSDGEDEPALYLARADGFYPDDPAWLGRHYGALSAGLELIPILNASALAIVNLEDGSGLAVASLVYSIADEAEAAAGVLAPWGHRSQPGDTALDPPRVRSEMGLYPLTAFLETRFYF